MVLQYANAVYRESDHTSSDPQKHITVVCIDAEKKGKSEHIPSAE
jgi:hypothetical protein